MNASYLRTVALLLDIAPHVFTSGRFAMKGGTALNLFVQEMPRLSVDIDVVYIHHETDRSQALYEIAAELGAVQQRLQRQGLRADSQSPGNLDEYWQRIRDSNPLEMAFEKRQNRAGIQYPRCFPAHRGFRANFANFGNFGQSVFYAVLCKFQRFWEPPSVPMVYWGRNSISRTDPVKRHSPTPRAFL